MPKATEGRRAVLITGASTGIGAACALELAAREFQVFAGVRRPDDGRRLVDQAGDNLSYLLLDVTDSAAVRSAAERVAEEVGDRGLRGLVNNAGILVSAPLEFVSPRQLRRQFDVNLFGMIAVTQAMLPMIRQAQGRIVSIGSIAGRAAPPYFGPYAASKHALEAVTDSLRMELRTWGISVSLVEPDSVTTPIWGKLESSPEQQVVELSPEAQRLYGEDVKAMDAASIAMDRRGMPVERVVRAVVHALSSRWPKTRYPVGFRVRLAGWAQGRIPDRIRDWYMLRELGMPRGRKSS